MANISNITVYLRYKSLCLQAFCAHNTILSDAYTSYISLCNLARILHMRVKMRWTTSFWKMPESRSRHQRVCCWKSFDRLYTLNLKLCRISWKSHDQLKHCFHRCRAFKILCTRGDESPWVHFLEVGRLVHRSFLNWFGRAAGQISLGFRSPVCSHIQSHRVTES